MRTKTNGLCIGVVIGAASSSHGKQYLMETGAQAIGVSDGHPPPLPISPKYARKGGTEARAANFSEQNSQVRIRNESLSSAVSQLLAFMHNLSRKLLKSYVLLRLCSGQSDRLFNSFGNIARQRSEVQDPANEYNRAERRHCDPAIESEIELDEWRS